MHSFIKYLLKKHNRDIFLYVTRKGWWMQGKGKGGPKVGGLYYVVELGWGCTHTGTSEMGRKGDWP